jgi:hypothetical protein
MVQRAGPLRAYVAGCMPDNQCACVLEFQGQCAINDHEVGCNLGLAASYEAYKAARPAGPTLCESGCAMNASAASRAPLVSVLVALSLLALLRNRLRAGILHRSSMPVMPWPAPLSSRRTAE